LKLSNGLASNFELAQPSLNSIHLLPKNEPPPN